MKRITLRWFGHIEQKNTEIFVKKIYASKIVCPIGEEEGQL